MEKRKNKKENKKINQVVKVGDVVVMIRKNKIYYIGEVNK